MTADLITSLSQALTTVGFPVAVAVYLLWDSRQSRKDHKEEMDKITEALNNNTEAIIHLTDRMNVQPPVHTHKMSLSPEE